MAGGRYRGVALVTVAVIAVGIVLRLGLQAGRSSSEGSAERSPM